MLEFFPRKPTILKLMATVRWRFARPVVNFKALGLDVVRASWPKQSEYKKKHRHGVYWKLFYGTCIFHTSNLVSMPIGFGVNIHRPLQKNTSSGSSAASNLQSQINRPHTLD